MEIARDGSERPVQTEAARELGLAGTPESLDDRDAALLAYCAKPSSDAATSERACERHGSELSAAVRDDPRRGPGDGDRLAEKPDREGGCGCVVDRADRQDPPRER